MSIRRSIRRVPKVVAHPKRVAFPWLCMGIAALALSAMPTTARAESVPMAALENAVLAEDWGQVTKLLESVDANTDSAVLRMIMGHACLAVNRNNESLRLFVSLETEAERQEWEDWTKRLAARHDENPIAQYLCGDALARQKRWEEARTVLERATDSDEDCYLAWNALGVVHHVLGNKLSARNNFARATRVKEDFADAYASRGTLNVCESAARATTKAAGRSRNPRSKKQGAAHWFQQARRFSPDYALAINGYGCAQYGEKAYDDAAAEFAAVSEDPVVAHLAEHNLLANELAELDKTIEEAADEGMNVRIARIQRDKIESAVRQNAHFARPGSKGGRLPGQGRRPPRRPGQGDPKPGRGGTKPKPGSNPGGGRGGKPGSPWPEPPIWKPIPGEHPWYPPHGGDIPQPEMPVPRLRSEIQGLRRAIGPNRGSGGHVHPIPGLPGGGGIIDPIPPGLPGGGGITDPIPPGLPGGGGIADPIPPGLPGGGGYPHPIPPVGLPFDAASAPVIPQGAPATTPGRAPGGITTKEIQNIRKNTGDWLVRNWYGLAYSLPSERTIRQSEAIPPLRNPNTIPQRTKETDR